MVCLPKPWAVPSLVHSATRSDVAVVHGQTVTYTCISLLLCMARTLCTLCTCTVELVSTHNTISPSVLDDGTDHPCFQFHLGQRGWFHEEMKETGSNTEQRPRAANGHVGTRERLNQTTTGAAGLSTTVARAGVAVRPASAT